MFHAPTGTSKAVTVDEDGQHTFSTADFGFSDQDNDSFASVVIVTPPLLGSLKLNGVDVTLLQRVDVADLGHLVWSAPQDGFGLALASFTFQVVDDSALSNTDLVPKLFSFDVSAIPDTPESAGSTFVVFQGETGLLGQRFNGWDTDAGDEVIGLEISKLPETGVLLFSGEAVVLNQFIGYEDYGLLEWIPPEGVVGEGISTIGFKTVSDGGVGGYEVDPTSAYLTINLRSAPRGHDVEFEVASEGYHSFTAADFGFSDHEGDDFLSIEIFEFDGGALTLNGNAVQMGDYVSVADLPGLRWTPAGDGYVSNVFQFRVLDDSNGMFNSNIDRVARSMTFTEVELNRAPTGSDRTRTILEDSTYTFAAADFGFSDLDLDQLAGVKITALPSSGLLKLNGASVSVGQLVIPNDLSGLAWTPPKNAYGNGLSSFAFQVVDDGGTALGGIDTDQTPRTFTFNVTSVLEVFMGTIGADTMTGTAENDTFFGLAGNDRIDGKGGADRMVGSTGNDSYTVDNRGDRPEEARGQGTDSVSSSVSWTLGTHFENLTLTGKANAAGKGNAPANKINGNAGRNDLAGLGGNDTLKGGAGNDTISGGAGRDALSGGTGSDRFVFDVRPMSANRDTISDFSARFDTMLIENAVFKGMGRAGKLDRDAFVVGRSAKDAEDRIVYNKKTGALSFDADGAGGLAAIQFATLTNKTAISAADFLVI